MLDEANLLLMAIDPQMQGKGLGYQLLETSIERLENQPVQIFLEVRESNKAAIGLYEKQVFIKLMCVAIITQLKRVGVKMPLLW